MTRIGIVGCGRILAAHLKGYRLLQEAGLGDFRITALCARKEADAQMYVERGRGPRQRPPVSDIPGDPLAVGDEYLSDFQPGVPVRVFTDFREMIASGEIDAVNDFTIHSLHHEIAREAFAAGLDVLTQKPLAVSVAAARRMCEEADARERVLGVFENARFRPATRHQKWLFESGRGGRLQMAILGIVGAWWAPDRIVAETPWRHRRDEGGGISLDMGVHQFDVIRHLAGEIKSVQGSVSVLEPKRFTRGAEGEVLQEMDCDADDTFFAQYEAESGVVGDMFASWCGHGEPTKFGEGLVLYGGRCRVTGNRVTFDGGEAKALDEIYRKECPKEERERCFPGGLEDPFALNQYDWLRAVEERRQPETSGWEGLRDLAAAVAILESAHAGRRVEVAEVLDGRLAATQGLINERHGIGG